MPENKTRPTDVPVADFLATVPERRAAEARILIPILEEISGEPAVMWGPSIIGFGTKDYETIRGVEQTPVLSFSPRKASLTVYFMEGFDHHGQALALLGPHTRSVSCLYLTRLDRVDLDVLTGMLRRSRELAVAPPKGPETVEEYVARIPDVARPRFDELRALVRDLLPAAREVLSYGIVGYVPEGRKRAFVFVSGWRDHVALYPVPADEALRSELAPFQKGKGTLWFALDAELPADLIRRTVQALVTG